MIDPDKCTYSRDETNCSMVPKRCRYWNAGCQVNGYPPQENAVKTYLEKGKRPVKIR